MDSKTFNHWLEFQQFAKSNGYDRLAFMALFPSGPRRCQWLDAYMGLVKIDGEDGFVMVRDLQDALPGTVCITLTEEEPT